MLQPPPVTCRIRATAATPRHIEPSASIQYGAVSRSCSHTPMRLRSAGDSEAQSVTAIPGRSRVWTQVLRRPQAAQLGSWISTARRYRPAFGFLPWLAFFLRALILRFLVFFDIGRAP